MRGSRKKSVSFPLVSLADGELLGSLRPDKQERLGRSDNNNNTMTPSLSLSFSIGRIHIRISPWTNRPTSLMNKGKLTFLINKNKMGLLGTCIALRSTNEPAGPPLGAVDNWPAEREKRRVRKKTLDVIWSSRFPAVLLPPPKTDRVFKAKVGRPVIVGWVADV